MSTETLRVLEVLARFVAQVSLVLATSIAAGVLAWTAAKLLTQ